MSIQDHIRPWLGDREPTRLCQLKICQTMCVATISCASKRMNITIMMRVKKISVCICRRPVHGHPISVKIPIRKIKQFCISLQLNNIHTDTAIIIIEFSWHGKGLPKYDSQCTYNITKKVNTSCFRK